MSLLLTRQPDKPTLIMMVGIPGSGKSTEAKELAKIDNSVILSSDAIREELFGNESDQSDNGRVFSLLYERMNKNLSEGKNVILDATNTTLKNRRRFFESLKVDCYEVAFVMTTSFEECVERDKSRSRSVGFDIIKKFILNFQCPQYFEGFDLIYFSPESEEEKDKYPTDAILNTMAIYDQKNPHHKYTLLKHSEVLAEEISKRNQNKIKETAAILHDIGKLFTASRDTNSNILHYYNHDCYGTYFLVTHQYIIKDVAKKYFDLDICNNSEILYILFFVNYHMLAHNIKTDKSRKKYEKIFGEFNFLQLIQFAECDTIATGNPKYKQ